MASNEMLSRSVEEFIASVAAKTPTPGGGSVAGVVGALGVALGEMALNFTLGKKKFAEFEEYHKHLSQRLAHARQMFFDLVSDDMSAYQLYQDSQKQPDGPAKEQAVQLAVAAAIDVPRETAKLALAVMADLLELAPKSNPYLISDLVAAAVLAQATVKLSDYNVRINAPQVADAQAGNELRLASAADVRRAAELLGQIEQAASAHLG